MDTQIDGGSEPPRLGLSVVSHQPVLTDIDRIVWAEQVGFNDVWTAEMPGVDPFIISALALKETTHLRVALGVAAIAARSATTTAVATQAIADLAPGRFILGLGTSSPLINQRWHGVNMSSPIAELGSYTRQVKELLSGSTYQHDLIRVRLPKKTAGQIPVYLGVLGPKMLNLATEVADGVMAVFVGPRWVTQVRSHALLTDHSANTPGRRLGLGARVFIPFPGDDPDALDQVAQLIARYATIPAYKSHFERLGYPELATGPVPPELLNDIVPLGNIDTQVAWLVELARAGCDSIALEPITARGLVGDDTTSSTNDMVSEHLVSIVQGWKNRLFPNP